MRLIIAAIGAYVVLVVGSCAADHRDILVGSLNECAQAESWMSCLKHRVLGYLDDRLGSSTEARSLETVDEAIVVRTVKYLKSFDYGMDLPLVDATLRYRPGRSLADLDVEFKSNDVATSQARGLLKKKLLLPFLLLLKLKLKALMPILVAIVGLKALKALVLSKLALFIVIGFVALQFFKKGGMTMPMGMSMEPAYGVSSISTTSSYDPANTWDGNGPYSRVWTPSNGVDSQNLAYSYYSPGGSSSSYSSSGASASSSSSASSSNY